ncbi:MAG: acylphosphatase [Cyclobacteriaceae bacterium]|nr:acylphosphatase [Cyclobacteriaceae bacterium]
MEVRHINITVSGKVQGVFYRASAKQKADEWGVRGFVRNERNGDVYLEAEAPEEILYKFIKWCNLGPTQAEVIKMDAKPGAIVGFTDFEIKRS